MGKLDGRVALVTGAARGQGRSHALTLAREGADVIVLDACAPIPTVPYPLPGPADLAETVAGVEAEGHKAVSGRIDIRDLAGLSRFVDDAVGTLGRLDIVCGNAGISSFGTEVTSEMWQTVLDVNLTGTWNTVQAALPHIRAGGRGGSIVLTSSVAGIKPLAGIPHYVAAKHGVVGLTKTLALELGPERIRVNAVLPTQVDTPLLLNDVVMDLFVPDGPSVDRFAAVSQALHTLPTPWLDPQDVSNAVLFLASDESRYITGVSLPVDAGALVK